MKRFEKVEIVFRSENELRKVVPLDLHLSLKRLLQLRIPFPEYLGEIGGFRAFVQCNSGVMLLIVSAPEGLSLSEVEQIERWDGVNPEDLWPHPFQSLTDLRVAIVNNRQAGKLWRTGITFA